MADRLCLAPLRFVLCAGAVLALLPALVRSAPLAGRPAVDDIFYHIMPIAWRDSDNDAARFGDFGGLTASLDYLQELGVTAVWLNPIFPSPAYHGYQHGPADQLNARFGTEPQFLDFVQQAHARGIKVFLDFVVYGISRDTVWFQSAYNNPASPYDDWLAFTNAANTQYLGSTYTTWNGSQVRFIHWNLNNPGPVGLVTGWSTHWLDPDGDGDPSDGIDGYRLDHVWANYNSGPNGWGYNIDDFWAPWKNALRAVNPDVFTFAEQADWGSYGVDLLPAHDASMTKPFEFAARNALGNGNADSLYSGMAATVAACPPGRLFVAIIGDHDVDRLATMFGDDLQRPKAAAAILLLQPYPPIIYYGDEIGMRGAKNTGYSGDAADIPMREPFKWNAMAGPPMSNYFVLNSAAYNGRIARDNDGRSVQEQLHVPGTLLEEYRRLIALRKARVALRRGTYHPAPASNGGVWAFVRHLPDEETLLVLVNVRGGYTGLTVDLSGFDVPAGGSPVQDIQTGAAYNLLTNANKAAYPLNVDGYGYRVLALNVTPIPPLPEQTDGTNIPADLGAGALRATQNAATAMGDNINELNQLFVRVQDNALRIGLTGNLATDGTGLALLLDTTAGGQNTLQTTGFPTPPNSVPQLNGLVLDTGFAPDYLLFVNAWSGMTYVDHYTLPTGGAGVKRYVGRTPVNGGSGTLSGGTNPSGMLVALNNTNLAGVTDTSAAAAATATTGFEMVLPFADFGLAGAGGSIRVLALLVYGDGRVGNQLLPGLGAGAGNLGNVPIDLNTIPGQQYATVPLERPPGDWDGNGRVDWADFEALAPCLGGPDMGALGPGCAVFDLDAENDIDLADVAGFQQEYAP